MQDRFTRPATRITAAYVILAGLWILFSDRWVVALFRDNGEMLHLAQTAKGWLFVILTGALLYSLMMRSLSSLKSVACVDPLCNLPNRLAFVTELEQRCSSCPHDQTFMVAILDIDRFSDFNDECGHDEGDALLALLGRRLVYDLGPDWYVARMGGDEFGLISPPGASTQAAIVQLDQIQRSVTRDSEYPILRQQRLSAGSSCFPRHGTQSQDVLRHADMALASAKSHGRNRHSIFDEQLKRELTDRLSLLKDLRLACANNEFTVVFQPFWHVENQSWSGAEVLIRWQHPTRGWIPPDVFIPLAEREGLIPYITEFIFEQALSELKTHQIDRTLLPCLSVNLAHPVLLDHMTMERIFSIIRRQGPRAPSIMMELTETSIMEDLDATLIAMKRWRRDDVEFAIDDFGTGYSSLSRLKQLPITELKIDRSFICDIPRNQNDAVITRAILAMARTLSLKVVAEGVETQQQMDFLARHGCTSLQGFFLARPMPIDSLQQLLHTPIDSALKIR